MTANNPFTQDIFPAGEETNAFKSKYAIALLRNPDAPFLAAVEVFGSDTGKALYASQHWIHDEYVTQRQLELLKTKGARAFLPTKEDYAREVWRMYKGANTPSDEKRHLLSLYGDIMGFKTQADKNLPGSVTNIHAGKVMIVKDHGSDIQWERAAMAQQQKLAEAANTIDVPARVLN